MNNSDEPVLGKSNINAPIQMKVNLEEPAFEYYRLRFCLRHCARPLGMLSERIDNSNGINSQNPNNSSISKEFQHLSEFSMNNNYSESMLVLAFHNNGT